MPGEARPSPLLRFLGAAGTVTGSRFLVQGERATVLVDCGLFQGMKPLRLRNWERFPVSPDSIDAVVLTHAHVDHCGYLPALARDGFRGRIFATEGTVGLSRIVLPDSGHLQEEDAAYANRRGFSKHKPARPLYTEADAERMLVQFTACAFGAAVEVADGIRATFFHAGHILGSAIVLLEVGQRRIVFSGDLGRSFHPLLRPPVPPPAAHAILVDSTYGDRRHPQEDPDEALAAAISRTAARGGSVIIPSFAVDRTEVILHALHRLRGAGRIPAVPVYVDSPMALDALALYRRAIAARSPEIRPEVADGGDPFGLEHVVEARSVEASKRVSAHRGPAVIVSASGMATGGRVLHHLAQRLPEPHNCVVLVGFQVAGTRGRALADGSRTLKLLGRYVSVNAEILSLPAFSAHADQAEILSWLGRSPAPPEIVYTVHGESASVSTLRDTVASQLGWTSVAPRDLETVRLD